MLVHMVFMGMVQVTIMKIVHMVAVLDGRMATARAMFMGMVVVLVASDGDHSTPRATPIARPISNRYPQTRAIYNHRNFIAVIVFGRPQPVLIQA